MPNLPKKHHNRYNLSLSDRMTEMIEDLKGTLGYKKSTSVIEAAIAQLYDRTFKYQAPGATTRDPLLKAKAKVAYEDNIKKEREDTLNSEKQYICTDLLGGTVENDGGANYCAYKTYHYSNSYKVRLPFSQISSELANKQYTPNKETVLKLLKIKTKKK